MPGAPRTQQVHLACQRRSLIHSFPNFPSRLVFAERLLEERVPLPCRFSDAGCPEQLLTRLLARHEADCGFQPVRCTHRGCGKTTTKARAETHKAECEHRTCDCPLQGCAQKIVYKDMGRHIEKVHLRREYTLFPRGPRIGGGRLLILAAIVGLLIVLGYQLLSPLDGGKSFRGFEL